MPQETKTSQEASATANKQSLEDAQTDSNVPTREEPAYSWPPIYAFPWRPVQVLLNFHGLMGLAYNKLGFCEIGMHSNAPQHECIVNVREVVSGVERRPFFTCNFGQLANVEEPDRIRLDIVEPHEEYSPPRFFMTGGEIYHRRDFRRVVDYESEIFYGRELKLKTSVFKPRLNIRSGVFFAGQITRDTYYRAAPNDFRYLGQVATVVSTAIYHKPEGYVALRIDKQELKLTPRRDMYYLIEFDNLCPDDVPDTATATGSAPTDFDLYADTFEIPEDREHYRLVKDGPYLQQKFDPVLLKKKKPVIGEQQQDSGPKESFKWLDIFDHLYSSRESPCGEAGFGRRTGGLSGS